MPSLASRATLITQSELEADIRACRRTIKRRLDYPQAKPRWGYRKMTGELQDDLGSRFSDLAYLKTDSTEKEASLRSSRDAFRAALYDRAYATGATKGRLQEKLGDSLYELGKLTKKPHHFKQSADAYDAALAVKTYATGAIAGRLESNLGNLFFRLGDLTNKSDDADRYYTESNEATRRALKYDAYARGATAGKLHHVRGLSLVRLADLNKTKNPAGAQRYYIESTKAIERALKNDAYARGETAGKLQHDRGYSLFSLGYLTNNSDDAEWYYTRSSKAIRRALKNDAYATGELAVRLKNNLDRTLSRLENLNGRHAVHAKPTYAGDSVQMQPQTPRRAEGSKARQRYHGTEASERWVKGMSRREKKPSTASKRPCYLEWNEEKRRWDKWTSQKGEPKSKPPECDALTCSRVSTNVRGDKRFYGLIDARLTNHRQRVKTIGFLALKKDSLDSNSRDAMKDAVRGNDIEVTFDLYDDAITLRQRGQLRPRHKQTQYSRDAKVRQQTREKAPGCTSGLLAILRKAGVLIGVS